MTKQHGGLLVDLGNVMIAHWLTNYTSKDYETLDYSTLPEVPGVMDSLRSFNERFGGNVTVVYKATDFIDARVHSWFAAHRFTERTGIPMARVCRTPERLDKLKHTAQESGTHRGTTMIVDDRLEVLSHFVGKVPHLFLFRPQQSEVERFSHTGAIDRVHVVMTWNEIEKIYREIEWFPRE